MKKLICALLTSGALFAVIYIPPALEKTTEDPCFSFSRILEEFNIQKGEDLHSIVKTIYPQWSRPLSLELWQMKKVYAKKPKEIMRHLKVLGLIDAIAPKKKHYDYAVVVGGALVRVRNRIEYLAKLYHKGVRFKKIVFICCQRPLDKTFETNQKLLFPRQCSLPIDYKKIDSLPTTEKEQIDLLLKMHVLPPGLDKIPIEINCTDWQKKYNGQMIRPSSKHTIKNWLETNPKKGSILLVTSQPFCSFQALIVKQALPKGFSLETVGDAALEEYGIEVYLDTIAKWLYEASQKKEYSYFRSIGIRALLSLTTRIDPMQIKITPKTANTSSK